MTESMLDTGSPPVEPIGPASHSSTREWQSFELRMRRRRVQRCVMRAEVALEAGLTEDAQEALDEARHLDSGTPTLEDLRARIAPVAPPVQAPEPSRRWAVAGAVALLLGLAAFSGWSVARSNRAPSVTAAAPAAENRDVALPSADGVARPLDPVTVKTDVARAAAVAVDAGVPATRPSPEPPPPPSSDSVVKVADRTPSPALSPVGGLTEREEAPPARPSLPLATEPAVPTTGTVAPPASPPPAPPIDDISRVRSVLTRYENAYSQLDAQAASAVWPSVDERALSRAFQGLQSQRLSLGRCDVAVSGTGATANCVGTASWTPKVGSGRTESRRWEFALQNAEGSWRIVSARAR